MSNVLVAYFSLTGNTQTMAEDIAEGVRMSGHEATVKSLEKIYSSDELRGYDGYIFGSPTHHGDMASQMKDFLFIPQRVDMINKLAGSFGSYTHTGDAPKMVYENLEHVLKMNMFELGPFRLEEKFVGTQEGRKACHDYGRVFGESIHR